MKIFVLMLFSIILLANEPLIYKEQSNNQKQETICKDLKIEEVKQRGCCSWHGGVSGCSGGRVTCNDGTYSPSCTCVIPETPLG